MIVWINYSDGSGVRFDSSGTDVFMMMAWDQDGKEKEYAYREVSARYVKNFCLISLEKPGRTVSFQS